MNNEYTRAHSLDCDKALDLCCIDASGRGVVVTRDAKERQADAARQHRRGFAAGSRLDFPHPRTQTPSSSPRRSQRDRSSERVPTCYM